MIKAAFSPGVFRFYNAKNLAAMSQKPRKLTAALQNVVNPVRKDGAFTPPFLQGIKLSYVSSLLRYKVSL
jgi:hypothetical protein